MNNLIFKESEVSGKFSLMISRPAPRARFGSKILANYYFRSAERREEYRNEFINNYEAAAAEKIERRVKKSEARKNLVNPYQEGDILYRSWGYDQTNINFFQVIEAKAKSVIIQEVGQIITKDEWAANMSEYVVAEPNRFIGKPFVKNFQVDPNGTPYLGSLSAWDGSPKYQSHYA